MHKRRSRRVVTKWRAARAARLRAWRLIPKLEAKALSCAQLGQLPEAGACALKALELRTKYPRPAPGATILWPK